MSLAKILSKPVDRKITPLNAGIHWLNLRIDKRPGIAAAVVPANKRGIT